MKVKVLQEITDPVQGKLNLFTNQVKFYSKRVAKMRAENKPHTEIDIELSFMSLAQNKVVNICQENGLDPYTILDAACSND